MASRSLFVELGVNDRKLGTGLRKSEKSFKRFGKRVGAGLKRAFSAASMIGGGGAAFGVAAIGKNVMDFEDTLDRLATQAGISSSETDALRKNLIGLSVESGVSRGEVVGAAKALIDLGTGMEFAESSMQVLLDANVATGASMEDLAALAFSLKNNFEVATPEDLTAGLNAMIEAGKQGNIPLDQMAATLKKVAASFAEFKGTGVQASAEVGIAMQLLGKKGFSTAEEAGTGIVAMMTALKRKAGKLRKEGINVFEKDENGVKSFRSIEEIIADIGNSKLAKDPELMTTILGRTEAEKAVKALVQQQGLFQEQMKLARASNAIQQDGDRRRKSQAHKLKKAWNDIQETIARVFTPERIEKFVEAVEKVGEIVVAIVDNLKTAVGLFAAAKLAGPALGMIGPTAGLLGKTGAGAAMNAAGAGALGAKGLLGAAGLLTAAGSLGYAFGSLMDDLFDFSGGLSDMAVDLFGPWEKVAEAGPSNKIEAVNERFLSGESDSATYNKERNLAFETQAYRASDATANLVGKDVMEQKGMSLEQLRKNVSSLDKEGMAEYRELARQIAIGTDQGKDTSDLANRLASIIANQKIEIVLNGNAVTSMLQNNGFTRIDK